jgi:hypothetical protein
MRIFLIFLLNIVFLSKSTLAQTVFAAQNSVWNYYLDGDGSGINFRYETEKDTLYEGKLCSKVIGKATSKSSITDLGATYFHTSGDTVFYYHDSLKSFTPLYIFNVQEGDTISLYSPSWYKHFLNQFRLVVSKIDTNIIDGLPLRTVHTNSIDRFFSLHQYTERIGGYQGAHIICIDVTRTADHSVGIRCYSDNDISEQFVSDKWGCDYVPNDIEEVFAKSTIEVYPNPASNIINVIINNSITEGQIFILSIDGRTVAQKEIKGQDNQVDISHLKAGLYLMQLKNKEEVYTQKLQIIQ